MVCGLSLGVPSATPQVEESDDAAAAAAEGSGSDSGDSGASADSGLTGKQGGLSAGELERQARAQEAGSLHGMDLSHDLGLASHDGLETSFTNYVRGYIGCLGLCLCVDFCVYVSTSVSTWAGTWAVCDVGSLRPSCLSLVFWPPVSALVGARSLCVLGQRGRGARTQLLDP